MSTILEHEQQALQAFQSNVAELAGKELDRLEAEREQLEQALTSVRGALRSVKATLTATQPKQPKAAVKKTRQKRNGVEGFVPSEEREKEFRTWLGKQPEDRDLTSAMLRASFANWSNSYHNMMMKWAREVGLLRQSGQAGSTIVYRRLG